MIIAVRILAVALGLLLSACNQTDTIEQTVRSMASDPEESIADETVLAIYEGDEETLRSHLHPALLQEQFRGELEALVKQSPGQPPDEYALVNYQWDRVMTAGNNEQETNATDFSFTYRAAYGDREQIIFIRMRAEGDGPPLVQNIQISPAPGANYASPDEWPQAYRIALGLAVATAVFVVITFLASLRVRRLKRRILWSLLILFVGYPVFVYSTAEGWLLSAPSITQNETGVNIQLFDFNLLGAGYLKNTITGVETFDIAVPLGALLFWLQYFRGKLVRKPEPGEKGEAPAPTGEGPADPAQADA
ncbi:hypothetical protein DDZ18_08200 [Marinicauda salina]|uniref:Uncharacterized protein n=1 Tax=Marinicauda salina TaxID=2135793 RepID=A0A2U2BUF6_9PROT|nr:tripartite tricarboxylate transporter TctB family protein [Marinicauda salina]PWE17632.1 hypothetical protein DDZ18_08200 [Marinicauda salina]